MPIHKFILFIQVFISSLMFTSVQASSLQTWMKNQQQVAVDQLHKSILKNGSVVASPIDDDHHYYFNWIRDAGLVMGEVFELSRTQPDVWNPYLYSFVKITRQHQQVYFGEPKYEVSGELFTGPWARPQNDGPAIRALTLSRWALHLLNESRHQKIQVRRATEKYVKTELYDSQLPTESVIKKDLEFTSHNWSNPSFDVWEEISGEHFWTRVFQRKALLVGAQLAERLGDQGASDWYIRQAAQIEWGLKKHFSHIILATLNRNDGIYYKDTNLDAAVILSLLYTLDDEDDWVSLKDYAVKNTVKELSSSFATIYSVNHGTSRLEIEAPLIGRYPEDRYAGLNFDGGNPWVLISLAWAEYYHRTGNKKLALTYIERVKSLTNASGVWDEQLDKKTGQMTSAKELTWNYAQYLHLLRFMK